MKFNKYILASLAIAVGALTCQAQNDQPEGIQSSILRGLEYEVHAGINIGGASPLPLPAEIRKINSFDPHLNLHIGTTVTKWILPDRKWGVAVGLRLETKGMETGARVKNYGMEIIQDGTKVKGRWTGDVRTKYSTQQLAIPITAVYRLSNRVKMNFGPYLAYAFTNSFDGYVSNGYLREGDPTGNKITFEGDSRATYDFGDELRHFQWGLQLGCSVRVLKRLQVNANLTWGLNDIFNSSFKTVSFNMYPIYLNIGFGYVF